MPLERIVESRPARALARAASSTTAASQATPSYHQCPSSSVSSAHTHTPPSLTRARASGRRSRSRARTRAPSPRHGRRGRRRCARRDDGAWSARGSCGIPGSPDSRVRSTPAPSSACRSAIGSDRRSSRAVAGGARRPARTGSSAPRSCYDNARLSSSRAAPATARRHIRVARNRPPIRRTSAGARRSRSEPGARSRCRWPRAGAPRGWRRMSNSACSPERRQQPARQRAEPLRGGRVLGRGALELTDELNLAVTAEAFDVAAVGFRSDLRQEARAPFERAGRLQLVAQDRRQRQRDRSAIEYVKKRQVRGRHGLPEPLLAERPRPRTLRRTACAYAGRSTGRSPGASRRRRLFPPATLSVARRFKLGFTSFNSSWSL